MAISKRFDKNLMSAIWLLLAVLWLVGCGGDTIEDTPAIETNTGVFLDGPVEGLGYVTQTQTGTTDEQGRFYYAKDEDILFFIGDIGIGQTAGRPVITPAELVGGYVDENHPVVNNIARFLLTLDDDNIPENGIQIRQAVQEAALGKSVNFGVSEFAFSRDPAVQSVVSELTRARTAGERVLVSAETARAHLGATLAEIDNDGDGVTEQQGDCDDTDPHTYPGAREVCGDGIDQDCQGRDQSCIAMLDFVNQARLSGHWCANRYYPPVEPLTWSADLADAATYHSQDMAENSFVGHESSNGYTFAERVAALGYTGTPLAENLGLDFFSSEEAVLEWLDNPMYCANIMNPDAEEMGGASARGMYNEQEAVYWNLVIGQGARDETYQTVRITTDFGDILIWLYELTPQHRENFLALVDQGFYNNLSFHRIVDEMRLEGGDPLGNGAGGTGYFLDPEIDTRLTHQYGAVGAVLDPNGSVSNGSQFYIVYRPALAQRMNFRYTVFGQVITGMDAVETMASLPADKDGFFESPPIIQQAQIVEYTEQELLDQYGYVIPAYAQTEN